MNRLASLTTPSSIFLFFLTNSRDILRPYEMGIRAYSNVNIKYFNPLAYDPLTKVVLF